MTQTAKIDPVKSGEFIIREDDAGKAYTRESYTWASVTYNNFDVLLPAGYPMNASGTPCNSIVQCASAVGYLVNPVYCPIGGTNIKFCVLQRGHNIINVNALPSNIFGTTGGVIAGPAVSAYITRVTALGMLPVQESPQQTVQGTLATSVEEDESAMVSVGDSSSKKVNKK